MIRALITLHRSTTLPQHKCRNLDITIADRSILLRVLPEYTSDSFNFEEKFLAIQSAYILKWMRALKLIILKWIKTIKWEFIYHFWFSLTWGPSIWHSWRSRCSTVGCMPDQRSSNDGIVTISHETGYVSKKQQPSHFNL